MTCVCPCVRGDLSDMCVPVEEVNLSDMCVSSVEEVALSDMCVPVEEVNLSDVCPCGRGDP